MLSYFVNNGTCVLAVKHMGLRCSFLEVHMYYPALTSVWFSVAVESSGTSYLVLKVTGTFQLSLIHLFVFLLWLLQYVVYLYILGAWARSIFTESSSESAAEDVWELPRRNRQSPDSDDQWMSVNSQASWQRIFRKNTASSKAGFKSRQILITSHVLVLCIWMMLAF